MTTTTLDYTNQIIQKLETLESVNNRLDCTNQLYLSSDLQPLTNQYFFEVNQLLKERQSLIVDISKMVFVEQLGRKIREGL